MHEGSLVRHQWDDRELIFLLRADVMSSQVPLILCHREVSCYLSHEHATFQSLVERFTTSVGSRSALNKQPLDHWVSAIYMLYICYTYAYTYAIHMLYICYACAYTYAMHYSYGGCSIADISYILRIVSRQITTIHKYMI